MGNGPNSKKRNRKFTKGGRKRPRRNRVASRSRPPRFKPPKRIRPHTAKQFFAMPKEFQNTWIRMTHVITKMRDDGTSLQKASSEFGLTSRTVANLAGSALRKRKGGRYVARPMDRLLRILVIPTKRGKQEIVLRNSRYASLIGKYWNAVHKYLSIGDSSALLQFRGKRIADASGKRWKLLTDLDALEILGSAGELSFESTYAKVR